MAKIRTIPAGIAILDDRQPVVPPEDQNQDDTRLQEELENLRRVSSTAAKVFAEFRQQETVGRGPSTTVRFVD